MYAELGCSLMSRLHSCENVIYMEIHCTDKPKRINHQYNTKVYQTVPLTCSSMIQIYAGALMGDWLLGLALSPETQVRALHPLN